MILADTSIWIDHIRAPQPVLAHLLNDGKIIMHPIIVGELSLGSLPNRTEFLATLHDMPMATAATDEEIRYFIENAKLYSRGVGYMDVSLLTAVRLTPNARIWTRDKRLRQIASELSLDAVLSH
ncbi:Ribonuclease VapC32 (plasmid) [Pararobbsia alpina]|uniref:type II toxin-antitoxin system VapC family toxin n=1 Tax=Pararobbsia alpina TaxID=621374 RepID=UPI0039A6330A